MAGYIIVDVKTRKVIAISTAVAICVFVIGILIGYFSRSVGGSTGSASLGSGSTSTSTSGQRICSYEALTSSNLTEYIKRYVDRHSTKHTCLEKPADCMDFDLPRNYIAYHLHGEKIKIDGKLDDPAWQEVSWTENFVDIRSALYPKPYLDTKVKIRWDDDRIYVGAYIQESNLWANYDTHDAKLHYENDFEMFMDVDGSMFNYKQIQINAIGTMMDQMLFKSPHDAWDRNANKLRDWHGEVEHAVYSEGTVNDPGDTDKYWSVEMSFTFEAVAKSSNRVQNAPFDNEVWFMQFGRVEYKLEVSNGNYVKPRALPDWWSWQPCDAVNLQLQDRWGLVQFKMDFADQIFSFQRWHIYKALFETFHAMKKYIAVNFKTTDRIEDLDVPPYLLSGTCVEVPHIMIYGNNEFTIAVKSKLISTMPGQIRNDRYVFFSDKYVTQ